MNIHKTAIIGPNAQIGSNVSIGPYSIIGDKVIIGDNVCIKSHVVIEGKVTIGSGSIIHPFASISYPQTLKYQGEDSEIIIGNNNTIREYVTIQHGTQEGGMVTKIGSDGLFMVGVHIAHNCKIGDNAIFANYASLAGHVEVGNHVTIGGLSAVHQYCRIGDHVMVGGVSGVARDLAPYVLAQGNRADLAGVNLVGLKRKGVDRVAIMELSQAIRQLFTSSIESTFAQRIEQVHEELGHNKMVMDVLKFIKSDSKRSFCKFR